jgi:hypothetical protein
MGIRRLVILGFDVDVDVDVDVKKSKSFKSFSDEAYGFIMCGG